LGLLAFVALIVTSCGVTTGSPAASRERLGAITGTLRLEVGIAALPNGGAVGGEVTALNGRGRRYSRAVPRLGRFTLRLPPGRYVLSGTSPRFDGGTSVCVAGPIAVRAGRTVHRDVSCEGP
jgi:hypothetical protein